MNFAYIGAIIAAILLIGFSVVAVILVAKSVKKSIRERTLELISDYDSILEQKSAELLELKKESELLEGAVRPEPDPEPVRASSRAADADSAAMLRAISRISSSSYRDGSVGAIYRTIRTGFTTSVREALSQIPPEELSVTEGPATALLRELPFTAIYELSSLSSDEQYAVLSDSLKDSQRELLETYREANKRFDSIGFYDYLKQVAGAEPAPCILRVSPCSRPKDIPDGLRIEEDESICEGFELVTNRRVYDYSVKIREIS